MTRRDHDALSNQMYANYAIGKDTAAMKVCVCVCARACVRACVHACVHVCVCVYITHAMIDVFLFVYSPW